MYIVILAAHFNSFSGPLTKRHRRCQAVSPSIHHITARTRHIYTQSFSVRVRPHIAQKASQLSHVPQCWWAFLANSGTVESKTWFLMCFFFGRARLRFRSNYYYLPENPKIISDVFIHHQTGMEEAGWSSQARRHHIRIKNDWLSIMLSQSSNII